MLRLLALVAGLAFAGPALAFDVKTSTTPGNVPTLVTPGEIAINRADKTLFFRKADNTVGTATLLNALAAGRKAVEQGDASDLIAKAPGLPAGASLATWLSTPYFAAATSPNETDAYASGFGTGRAAFSVVSGDDTPETGKERYGAWIAYTGAGTGDPAVLGSHFALGISSLKKNWWNTTVPGQTIGTNIVVRGGYHGADANSAPPEFGGYNPAGDATAIIVNSVQSSPYAQNAIMEAALHYMKNGIMDVPNGDIRSMNVQLGAMKILNPDGSPGNAGIGVNVAAIGGVLDYAYQANNTARAGSYGVRPGHWAGFLRYNRDDGTNPPYDAFRVGQDGTTCLRAATGSTPSKCVRAGTDGTLQVLNNAGTVVARIGDNGSIYIDQAGAALMIQGTQVVGARQAAISDALTDTAKIAAILTTLRTHGLIAP